MRLDPNSIEVQSFATTAAMEKLLPPSDTGQGGPQSYCWICEPTDDTVPSCWGYQCGGGTEPDTFVNPVCTYA
jgi:hypothetical protein